MGDGARRGLAPSLTVAERRGLVSILKGLVEVGLTAEFGGTGPSFWGFAKDPLLRESLRRRAVPRSTLGSGRG